MNRVKSSWQLVVSGVSQGQYWGWPCIIDGLNKGIECTSSKFVNDTSWEELWICLRLGRLQWDLNRLITGLRPIV